MHDPHIPEEPLKRAGLRTALCPAHDRAGSPRAFRQYVPLPNLAKYWAIPAEDPGTRTPGAAGT